MVLQWPALRIIADSERVKSSFDRVPARTSSLSFHTPVPQPSGAPRKLPLSIGPPGTTTAGMSTLAAAISSEGIVLSQPRSEERRVGKERTDMAIPEAYCNKTRVSCEQ